MNISAIIRLSIKNIIRGRFAMLSNWLKQQGLTEPEILKLKKISKIVLGVILVLIIVANSAFQVNEQTQVIVHTFGTPVRVETAGLGFKIPFIQNTKKIRTTIIGQAIGYSEADPTVDIPTESLMITGDYNFLNVSFYLEVQVTDPVKAKYSSENVVIVSKALAQSAIRSVIGQYTVDNVLTSSKTAIESEIQALIQAELTNLDLGIRVVNIKMQDAEPPTLEVINAFKAVESAKQARETAVNTAKEYENSALPLARAEGDRIVKDAEAKKENRINEAQGQVARFNKMFNEYIKNPGITKQRMYYETLEQVLPGLKVIYDGSDSNLTTLLPLESFINTEGDTSNAK